MGGATSSKEPVTHADAALALMRFTSMMRRATDPTATPQQQAEARAFFAGANTAATLLRLSLSANGK